MVLCTQSMTEKSRGGSCLQMIIGEQTGRVENRYLSKSVNSSPLRETVHRVSTKSSQDYFSDDRSERRSGVSLPVAHDAVFARVASVRLGLALFPVPAHRTEQARFTHSALGESVTRSPTESWSSAY